MVGSVAASVMSTRVEPKFLIAAGSLMAAIGLLALSRLQVGAGFGTYGWSLALLGFGAAFAGAPASVAILASVPLGLAGTASGAWNTFRQLRGSWRRRGRNVRAGRDAGACRRAAELIASGGRTERGIRSASARRLERHP